MTAIEVGAIYVRSDDPDADDSADGDRGRVLAVEDRRVRVECVYSRRHGVNAGVKAWFSRAAFEAKWKKESATLSQPPKIDHHDY